MNLRETVRSGYKVFSRMQADKKKAHVEAIQYIELLANQTNTKMEPWDLLAVFGTGKGNELHTDKKEINQRFFKKCEEIKNKTPAEVFALEQRVSEKIDQLTRDLADREKNRLQRDYDSLVRSASTSFDAGTQYLVRAAETKRKMDTFERRESPVPAQLTEVLGENFWDFHQLTGNFIELVTKNDTILTYKNPSAGIDLRVNMGKFLVSIDLTTFSLKVIRYTDNVYLNGYYHPHVNTGGGVCWGSAAITVTEKLPRGEIKDVLMLLASVLTNYNNDNPYVALNSFKAEAERVEKERMRRDKEREEAAKTVPVEAAIPTPPQSIGSGGLEDPMLRALRESTLAYRYNIIQNSTVVHPTDSTQAPVEGCLCQICEAGRVSRGRQEELNRLQTALASSIDASVALTAETVSTSTPGVTIQLAGVDADSGEEEEEFETYDDEEEEEEVDF